MNVYIKYYTFSEIRWKIVDVIRKKKIILTRIIKYITYLDLNWRMWSKMFFIDPSFSLNPSVYYIKTYNYYADIIFGDDKIYIYYSKEQKENMSLCNLWVMWVAKKLMSLQSEKWPRCSNSWNAAMMKS